MPSLIRLPGIFFCRAPLRSARAIALFCFLLASSISLVHGAQPTPTSIVPISIDSGGKSAVLQIPENCTSVTIERRARPTAKWTRFRILKVNDAPTSLSISIPKLFAKQEWRAMGVISSPTDINLKYPAAFYRGLRKFGSTAATSYDLEATGSPTLNSGNSALLPVSNLVSADSAQITAPSVEESDIWKADGTTIFFFNQLRGLQVIDLAHPAEPTLIASLRLPASGQDLYVLPGDGSVRYAILLTESYDRQSYRPLTGVKVVRVEGSVAKLVSDTELDGWMADSRLLGNRLYLATQTWAGNGGASKDATTLRELVLDPSSGAVSEDSSHEVPGSWPLIAAGNDWLAIAAQDVSDWQTSHISLFQLGETGATPLTAVPVTTSGRIYDKFNMQYAEGTLSVISQKWVSSGGAWWNNTPVTELQTFSSVGDPLGSLEIIRGEQLHATRFADKKVYVVTFQQIDPLWVIDLTDPKNPVIAGQIEVPGWSTYIEPLGDMLFSIGFDGGKVAASLFDVSDATKPALLKRVQLEGAWGFSEATYDEKALKVLPDSGLVLVPYSKYDANGLTTSYVQLLDLDIKGRDLRLRGKIAHDFQPRRATVIDGSLASISQRQLVTADIADRDQPIILADLLLAWPVDRIVSSGDYLIEIADGSSWSAETPVARIALVSDPDSVIAEVNLGEGAVRDAVLRDNKLYVLRQTPVSRGWGWWIRPIIFTLNTAQSNLSDGAQISDQPTLYLDVYDASALPNLTLTGSVSTPLTGGQTYAIGELLWASPTTPVVISQPQSWSYWWGWGQPVEINQQSPVPNSLTAASGDLAPNLIYQPHWKTPSPAVAVIFQVVDASAPTVLKPVTLTAREDTSINAATAGGGFLVFGYGSKAEILEDGAYTRCQHNLKILDLQDPNKPVLRSPLDLPGKLFAVTDISHDGFLAWTESFASDKKRTTGGRTVQVSAFDGKEIIEIASLNLTGLGTAAAYERTLYLENDGLIQRYLLGNTGNFLLSGSVALDWSPTSLLALPDGLLGADWNHLFRAVWSGETDGEVFDWESIRSTDIQRILPLEKGSVLLPAGEYGVDRLDP